jgi:hypothetical protein
MFDFNISIIFPPTMSIDDCRLPADMGNMGSPWLHPEDVDHGEVDYDPFKLDVGCLGNLFRRFHVGRFFTRLPEWILTHGVDSQHLTPMIPLLAPLLDRMATNDISNRFTASEALAFIRFIRRNLDSKQLGVKLHPQREWNRRGDSNPWESLPDGFRDEFRTRWTIDGEGWLEYLNSQTPQ